MKTVENKGEKLIQVPEKVLLPLLAEKLKDRDLFPRKTADAKNSSATLSYLQSNLCSIIIACVCLQDAFFAHDSKAYQFILPTTPLIVKAAALQQIVNNPCGTERLLLRLIKISSADAVHEGKNPQKDKVNIITLGCSKNMVDSEVLSGQLIANQISAVHESTAKDHNIVIVNTCGFIDKAKEESVNTILQQVALKKRGRLDKVYVTGCLSQRYRDDLEQSIPEVDAWFGTMELPLILKKFEADYKTELVGERLLATPQHYAYIKISEGCNRTCSFCAIPLMRGQHVSRSMEDLVKEVETLARRGVKEIMLIAQELTYYGLDLYKKRMLPDLLRRLSDVEGIEWIRLHYAYPHKFPMEILPVIKERSNICNYLDMPLQHAADAVLKAMRRNITRVEIEDLVSAIRSEVPGICLRTTLIAGFPGETQDDVEELKGFLERQRFDRVGIFTYSHEESTSAYGLADDIPADEKQRRAEEIMEVQQEISLEKNQEKIGRTLKVIIDKNEAGRYLGRTEYDSVEVDNEVIIPATTPLLPGQFVQVKITKAYDYDLEGELVAASVTNKEPMIAAIA